MNTEKAVKWLNNFKVCMDNEVYCDDDKKLTLKELKEVAELLERGDKFEKIYNELEGDYSHLPFSVAGCTLHSMKILKEKYFPKPCSNIKQLEQFKAEFVKSEHSYYMERFMETCIKLFKEKL